MSSYPRIFLDIDGVLVNRRSLKGNSGMRAKADPKCVYALNWLTEITGAGIVVSSTWRSLGLLEMRTILKQAWGVTGAIVGMTPHLSRLGFESSRGHEITAYLNSSSATASPFVILDDDSDMGVLAPWLVRTEFEAGLTEHDARKAIGILESGRALRDLIERNPDGE